MNLVTQDWFQNLVEDCKAIITESVFTSNWALIEGYHLLGKRILEENGNFERSKIYGEKIASRVAESLGKSERTIDRAIQFYKKFPDLGKLPDGKAISWTNIVRHYLPEHASEIKDPRLITCPFCGKEFTR